MKKYVANRANEIFAPSLRVKHLAGDWTRPVGRLRDDDDARE